jgi:hypothetical protein
MTSSDAQRVRLFPRALRAAAAATIGAVLDHFPPHLIAQLVDGGTQIVPLAKRERYADVSRALRRLGVDVDAWPVPPAGLFVVEERSLYLRSTSRMTVAHELGHALDCALGGGVYRSGFDPAIRRAFSRARDFVTPYAACGLDEYFAEGVRAFCEMNDDDSPWPAVTRARLASIDAGLHAILAEIFAAPVSEAVSC